jgi:hypothetical protein
MGSQNKQAIGMPSTTFFVYYRLSSAIIKIFDHHCDDEDCCQENHKDFSHFDLLSG